MEVIERKPAPIYEVECYECHSKIRYKKSEVYMCHITCPVCGVSLWDIGCAIAKIAPKGKENYSDDDFENAYAQIEPLSEDKAEIYERFNTVERVMTDLGLGCAYDMPSFWCNKGKDYKVIPTKYHKGYIQALEDVEKEVRLRFGFAERDNLISTPFDGFFKAEEGK